MKRDDQTPGKDPGTNPFTMKAETMRSHNAGLRIVQPGERGPETAPNAAARVGWGMAFDANLSFASPGRHLANAEMIHHELPDAFAWTEGEWLCFHDGAWDAELGGAILEELIARAVFTGGSEHGATQGNLDSVKTACRKKYIQPARVWDADPDMAGVPGGVLNLKTGKTRDALPEDRITKSLACAPEDMDVSLWLGVLNHALAECGGDNAVSALRTWMRLSLFGRKDPQDAIVFLQGREGTSKSTIVRTLLHIHGTYGHTVGGRRLVGRGGEHTQWLAACKGMRLVSMPEIPRGAFQSEDLNTLADGERMEANPMFKGSINFHSTASIAMHSNNRPSNSNPGLYRRLKVFALNRQPPVKDLELGEKLQAISPGILKWLLDDRAKSAKWPAEVAEEVAAYKLENDPVGEWISSSGVELEPGRSELVADVVAAFNAWHRENGGGGKDWLRKTVTAKLKEHDVSCPRGRTVEDRRPENHVYVGLRLVRFQDQGPPSDMPF